MKKCSRSVLIRFGNCKQQCKKLDISFKISKKEEDSQWMIYVNSFDSNLLIKNRLEKRVNEQRIEKAKIDLRLKQKMQN